MHKLISTMCGKHIQILDTETDIWITRIAVAVLVYMHMLFLYILSVWGRKLKEEEDVDFEDQICYTLIVYYV